MSADKISVDEAQRSLPEIIEALRKEGGRVDIVLDGVPVVSLVPAQEAAPAAQIVEEAPPPRRKRSRGRSTPKQPRLQHAHKREPRADD